MKTNELNQDEMKSTNGGQMMPPPPSGNDGGMSWIWPEQAPGYVSSSSGNDGQASLTQDNGSVSGTSGSDDNGGPYVR